MQTAWNERARGAGARGLPRRCAAVGEVKVSPGQLAAAAVAVAGAGDAPREDQCEKLRPHSSPPRYRSRSRRADDAAARRGAQDGGQGAGGACWPHRSPSASPHRQHSPQHRVSDCSQCRCHGAPRPAYFAPHPPGAPLELRARPSRDPAAAADAATCTPPQVKGRSRNQRRIRSMLRELVARVPSEARRRHARRAQSPPPAPPPAPAASRWFARLAEEETRGGGAGASWAQGVRALRDAHVRLVQRQLRHLRRLNAAVDAAALH